MLKEFKEFAFSGNLMDVAIAFVTGAATATFITAFTDNMISPLLGLIGGADFKNLGLVLKEGDPGVVLKWGAFLTAFINFVFIMFAVFMIVKAIKKFKKEQPAAPAAPPRNEVLLEEIRDLLKKA